MASFILVSVKNKMNQDKIFEQFHYFNIHADIDSAYGNWAVSTDGNVVTYCTNTYDAADVADVFALMTEWSQFRMPFVECYLEGDDRQCSC